MLLLSPEADDGQMFDDVVVFLDGSTDAARALGPGAAIAHYLGVSLVVVGFYEGSSRQYLDEAVDDQARGRGVVKLEVVIEPLVGSVGAAVARMAKIHNRSLICMSTHGRGRSAAVLGSVASEVLEATDRPVMLVGPAYAAPSFRCHGPFVVALNGSPESRSILRPAQDFATLFDYEVEITTVIDPGASAEFERLQASWDGGDIGSESATVRNAAAEAEQALKTPVSFTVLHHADPVSALVDYATETHAALVAMATHNRTGPARALSGSTVAGVARHSPSPVLVIQAPRQ